MTPSRLALVQEFERQLTSPALCVWFDAVRCQRDVDAALRRNGPLPFQNPSNQAIQRHRLRFLGSEQRRDLRPRERQLGGMDCN